MTNRDFRKNLALLCALAGGAAALSSVNVSTSAMEKKDYSKMSRDELLRVCLQKQEEQDEQNKLNTKRVAADFALKYNYYQTLSENDLKKELTEKQRDKIFELYKQDIPAMAAFKLSRLIDGDATKTDVMLRLDQLIDNTSSYRDSEKIKLLQDEIDKSDEINWATRNMFRL